MNPSARALTWIALLGAAGALAARPQDPAASAAHAVDFRRDVEPLFAARCYECHGANKQKAGLRLDRRADALAGAQFGAEPVIVPGKSAESALYARVVSTDEDERMPATGEPLTAAEIATLREWIDAGAPWPKDAGEGAGRTHWAYVAPVRPAVPVVAGAHDPIDAFVRARLAAEGLAPAPEADRATLIRRLSLDLVGLPPTVAEVDAFVADPAPDAYERLVARLLASPHYGEHMASQWLDLARYADTNGYEKDDRRVMWRYRDWVIDAFNRDLPYDRFVIEQLAGDLLPDATLEQRIATGFHRNTLINEEGGVDPEEFRVAAVIDRVNTTGAVLLGSTIGCAQCHNHKYDPFSQKDYFRLLACFDSTADTGNKREPVVLAPTPAQTAAVAEKERAVAALESGFAGPDAQLDRDQAAWEAAAAAALPDAGAWRTLAPVAFAARNGTTLVREEDALAARGPDPAMEVYDVTLAAGPGSVRALRVECLAEPGAPGAGRAPNGNFVLTGVELETSAGAEPGGTRPVPLAAAVADYSQSNGDWRAGGVLDQDRATAWAAGSFERGGNRTLVLLPAQPLELGEGARLRVVLRQESPYAGHNLARVRFSATGDAALAGLLAPGAPAGAFLFDAELAASLRKSPAARDDAERTRLREVFRRTVSPRGVELARALDAARVELKALRDGLPTCMVMAELPEPRVTHVFKRGDFRNPGDVVEPGVPEVLGSLPAGARADRLALARWIVSPADPLAARVAVNRAWERLFGTGLVATSDDFGTRGDPPSHPELLDWLAVEFVESGWSTKALLARIVGSATYRQSSRIAPGMSERDPWNRLLARGPRLRVEAERVRDVALAVSGLLDPAIGGPSVFPPQPEGTWNVVYNGDQWATSTGGDRYRRGMYTFLRRSAPYPTFNIFDAPSRELVCTRRARSNTPLQALVMLNDPVFVEAAGALARRVLREAPAGDAERAAFGFRLCVARAPSERELALLLGLLAGERERFAREGDAAQRFVAASRPAAGGDPAEVAPAELAAWTVLANALLNLDETITKS